ncbi:helix-turn-helix transcriptional regulator [uncultured Planococcus sp.]|uniref:helix-turn-helix domain-containing protein n=1 Tax=uncultured Planococcus sp. TaxID=337815 RepID=UPI0026247968|nr:helix-turn-helix transcriptional regulator [uncultured Planococcus sp.]
MKSLYNIIGERIQKFINDQNISQKEFAEKLNVSPQVMNKIVQGKKAVNAIEIQKIASVMSLSMDELIGEVQQPAAITDPILYMVGKTDNEQTKEKLRFLDYVMDQMLNVEQKVN